MSKVSCLVCVHSRDKHTDDMLVFGLKSVLNQTHPVDEIVVVLDECWAPTRGRVLRLSETIKVVSKSPKNGLANAKNYGLEYCTGDWITYLDADDAWMPCKIEEQLKCRIGKDFIGALAWDRWPVEDAPVHEWPLKPSCFRPGQYESHGDITSVIQRENVLCHGSMMIRAEALRELGGYQDVRGAEDWQLWKRAVSAGYRFYNIPERLYIWTHGTSVER